MIFQFYPFFYLYQWDSVGRKGRAFSSPRVCVCVCVYVCLCACDLYNFMDSYLFYRLLHIIVIIYSDAQIVPYLASGSPFEPPLVSFC